MKTIDTYIILTGIVFNNAIINSVIAMTDISPVQFSILAKSLIQEMIQTRK